MSVHEPGGAGYPLSSGVHSVPRAGVSMRTPHPPECYWVSPGSSPPLEDPAGTGLAVTLHPLRPYRRPPKPRDSGCNRVQEGGGLCRGGLSQFSMRPIGTGQVPARPPAQPLREQGNPIPFIKRVKTRA